MGFTSVSDLVNKVTAQGKFWRADWNKVAGASTYAAGRWYDMTYLAGTPPLMVYGDLCTNGIIAGNTANGWTLGANWFFTPGNAYINKTAGALNNLSQSAMTIVAGHTYLLKYTLASTSGGTITPSIGGTAAATRADGTWLELIVAANANPLVFVPSLAAVVTRVSNVSVVDCLYSAQLSDTMLSGAMYHGGNVTPATKHLLSAGIVATAATLNPSTWLLCDMLLAYPGVDMNSAALQTLTTTLTLPRYANGKGVMAFFTPTVTLGANAHDIWFKYTNTAPLSGQAPPVRLSGTISAIPGHIYHSGAAADNYGPFIPLARGDIGITKADSIQLSVASGTALTFGTLVLCKPLCYLPNITVASMMGERDFLSKVPSLPRIMDGACLGLLMLTSGAVVASSNIFGYMDFGWG